MMFNSTSLFVASNLSGDATEKQEKVENKREVGRTLRGTARSPQKDLRLIGLECDSEEKILTS